MSEGGTAWGRAGVYRLTAELPGFTTVTKTDLQVQVGQQAVFNFQISPSALQESMTVTSAAPLIDVTQSKLGGNIDTRQMQELPINGRNWMQLTLLAPGSRADESAMIVRTEFGADRALASGRPAPQLQVPLVARPATN